MTEFSTLPPEKRFNAAFLMVPLFLVMLFFFIMLVTLSHPHPRKSAAILNSLEKTFGTILVDDSQLRKSSKLASQHYLIPLKHLLQEHVAILEAKTFSDHHDKLSFSAPLSLFFETKSNVLRPEKHQFFRSLAYIMEPSAGSAMSSNCLIGASSYHYLQEAGNLAIQRATHIAQQLLLYGAKSDYISIGVQSAEPDQIICHFQVENVKD